MIDIRPLAKEDLPALLMLYRHLHSSDDPLPSPRQIEAVWSEIMSNEHFQYFGGFLSKELVSTCTLTTIPNLTRGCRPYGLIENVVTHPTHRKHGYGKAMLHAALSCAWTMGCYKVMLLTGRKDEATLRFYQSVGFDPNGKQAFIAKPSP